MLLREANRRTRKKAAPLPFGPSQIARGLEVTDQRFKWNGRKLYCIETDVNKFGHDGVEWRNLIKKSCRKVLCRGCSGVVVNRVQWGRCEQGEVGTLRTGWSEDVVNRVKWGCCEEGEVGMLWAGWSEDVVKRAQWGCPAKGEVGVLWTGRRMNVVNRVKWGHCEQGEVGTLWTGCSGDVVKRLMNIRFPQNGPNLRPAKIQQCLSLWSVLLARRADIWRWRRTIWCLGLDVSAENVQFWFICSKCTETDADMKIMQTAALCTTARGGDAAWYLSWGVTYRL